MADRSQARARRRRERIAARGDGQGGQPVFAGVVACDEAWRYPARRPRLVLRALSAWEPWPARARPRVPARIVSTSPSITETLFALGLGDRVVGVSSYCWFPPDVATLPKVGTFLQPDVELIARLRPDLVFVHAGPARDGVSAEATRHLDGHRRSRVAAQRLRDDSTDRRRGRSHRPCGTPRARPSPQRLDRVKASVAGNRPATRVLIIVGRRTGTLTDIIGVGPGSYLHDIADARRWRERAGVDADGVSENLDGDRHQPGPGRHHRRRRDGRVARDVRPAASHDRSAVAARDAGESRPRRARPRGERPGVRRPGPADRRGRRDDGGLVSRTYGHERARVVRS